MAVSQLTTAVEGVIDRIVALEPLAIAEVKAGTFATKEWGFRNAEFPYWANRISSLVETPRRDKYTMGIEAKLIVAHVAAGTVDDGTGTPLDLAWQYVPEMMNYFTEIRTTLAPSGFAEVDYLAPEGLTITSLRGLDSLFVPQANFQAYYIDFQFIVPFKLVAL